MSRRLQWVLGIAAVVLAVGLAAAAVAWPRSDGPPSHATVTVTATPPSASAAPSSTPSTTPAADAAAEPLVRGNQLVDARTGATFVPRGVDWSSFEYACTHGWGYSALDTLGANAATTEAKAIRSWNVNTVRLPLNQDCWLGTRGAPVSTSYTDLTAAGYRAAVRSFVTALNQQGIVVILDLQSRKRVGQDDFGNLAMPDASSLVFWKQVATAFATDRSVMFDAFNEPYSWRDASGKVVFDLSWQCWRDGGCHPPVEDTGLPASGKTYTAVGMDQVVSTIRAAGARQPILLGGLDYANDLSQWLEFAPHDDQLVAAFHNYDFTSCSTQSCWDETIAPLAQKVPVLTSELGAQHPTAGYVSNYLDWADAHGIGVLFWAWEDSGTDSMALTTVEQGTPSAYGRLARAWLEAH